MREWVELSCGHAERLAESLTRVQALTVVGAMRHPETISLNEEIDGEHATYYCHAKTVFPISPSLWDVRCEFRMSRELQENA